MSDFSLTSAKTAKTANVGSMCCSYGTMGKQTKGYDCLMIPGARFKKAS